MSSIVSIFYLKLNHSVLTFAFTISCIGSGELFTWGSNENGCLGMGYVPCMPTICSHRILISSLVDPSFVFSFMETIHFPERIEGPFSKNPVSQVCTIISFIGFFSKKKEIV